MNELKIIDDFSVNYKAPEITIANEEELGKAVAEYATQYNGMVVTEETFKGAKASRATLNKLSKALNDRRKEIKREYNAPLKEFEAKVKSWDTNVKDAISGLDVGIKDLEERQRQERADKVQALIEEMAPNYGVDPAAIEVKDSWKAKSISKKKITDEIASEMKQIKQDQDNLQIVKDHCERNHWQFTPYREFALAFGPLQAIQKIDEDIEEEKKTEEARKAAKVAEVERQKENTVQVNGHDYDKETGETVREEQKVTFTLQGTQDQLDSLARYVKTMGIKVLLASDRETVIVRGQ